MNTQDPTLKGLYIVATPIGNIEDITLRALNVLKGVELILCEDTRVTGKLLARLNLKKSMYCYNDFATDKIRAKIIEKLHQGITMALVSDAGTPLISDPGFKLIKLIQQDGTIDLTTLPGPSSVIAALTLAGLPTNRFLFEGFLPPKQSAKRNILESLKDLDATLVFFESAVRLASTISELYSCFGNREASILRELTKQYEEVKLANLLELDNFYQHNPPPKGEIIIVVGPPQKAQVSDLSAIDQELECLLEKMSLKDAVAFIAANSVVSKKIIYQRALQLIGVQRE